MPAKKPIRRARKPATKEHVIMTSFDPKTGRDRVGLRVLHVPESETERVTNMYKKVSKWILPEYGMRILRFPDKSHSKSQQPSSSGKTVSMHGISARKWNRAFGKKRTRKKGKN